MQAAVNVMFANTEEKKGITFFDEIAIAAMIKQFKQLDEGSMSGKPVVIPLNTDELTYTETRQALEAINLIK